MPLQLTTLPDASADRRQLHRLVNLLHYLDISNHTPREARQLLADVYRITRRYPVGPRHVTRGLTSPPNQPSNPPLASVTNS